MTITRRDECGFELGDNDEVPTIGGSATVSGTKDKSGNYSLRMSGEDYGRWDVAATRQLRMAAHFNHNGVSSGDPHLFSLRDSSGTLIIGVRVDNGLSAFQIFNAAGTTIASGSIGAFSAVDTWTHIGFDVLVNSSTGFASVYVDGVLSATITGTNTGNSDVERVHVGGADSGEGWDTYLYADDFYVDDSTGEGSAAQLDDLRFVPLTPNGNGNYSEWDGSDGNSTDNYLLVDDIPPDDDTTYITTDVDTEQDSFAMTTYSLPAGFSFQAIIPVAYARKEDAGSSAGVSVFTRYSGTDDSGSKQSLTTSYAVVKERFTTQPGGGAWDQTSVDGLEVGVEHEA